MKAREMTEAWYCYYCGDDVGRLDYHRLKNIMRHHCTMKPCWDYMARDIMKEGTEEERNSISAFDEPKLEETIDAAP